ncbi:MAG TPA: maleylacetoacetate isomerase [Paracoccaceae bacterium]|nr:maleylacetoacetate isomerase [Paracoccaceae bacterium]
MITLYDYWRSSASFRVRIALAHLGLTWTSIPVDLLAGNQRGADNLGRNPQGLVPSLEIDGLTLTQSCAIIEYLNETRGGGLLPGDPGTRARVRALSYAVAMEIHPVCNLSVGKYAVEASGGQITTESWMRHFISRGLTALEEMLVPPGTGRFCQGDGLTMADCCLVPQIYNARRWGVDLSALPRITQIDAALQDLPAVRAAHPDRWKPA